MIRVIIERHIAPSLEDYYDEFERTILQNAITVPGYLSGETLRNTNDPNHRFIICNWRSILDWQHWEHSEQRRDIVTPLRALMDRDEIITVLELC
ncbi:MAG: antibiotic biosynthesis monooxygenase [Gammaproteobacteria bacterium]|nr:MAG: antibiotic biosynthesis monooxygenase [Gammaproteobacteria bacterium]